MFNKTPIGKLVLHAAPSRCKMSPEPGHDDTSSDEKFNCFKRDEGLGIM